jgi:hypothetical protein
MLPVLRSPLYRAYFNRLTSLEYAALDEMLVGRAHRITVDAPG